jgi:hypothetical protein
VTSRLEAPRNVRSDPRAIQEPFSEGDWRGSTATATRVLPTMIRYPSEPVGRGGDAAGGRAFRRAFSGWGGDPQMVAEDDLLESPLPTHPVGYTIPCSSATCAPGCCCPAWPDSPIPTPPASSTLRTAGSYQRALDKLTQEAELAA